LVNDVASAASRAYRPHSSGNDRQLEASNSTVAEYLTILEVCGLLKLSERTVYDLCRRRKLAGAAKIGNQWRVNREELQEWLKAGGAAAVEKTLRDQDERQ